MSTDTPTRPPTRRRGAEIILAATAEFAVQPDDFVMIDLAAAVFGITRKAIEKKIERGDWLEGRQYHRDPQGGIWISRKGVRAWVAGDRASK